MRRLNPAVLALLAATALSLATPTATPSFATPLAAAAREVLVPIEFDAGFVRRVFVGQVFTAADDTARVWDDGSGCNFLTLAAPEVSLRDGRVHLTSPARARVGTRAFGRCIAILDWTGFVEVVQLPRLEPGTAVLGFTVVDSNLYGPKREKQLAGGVIWDWVKAYVHPRLETVKLDLGGPLADVRAFLPLMLPDESAARVGALLDSIALANLRGTETGVAVDLRLEVPPRAEPPPIVSPSPEPTLTAEEIAAWETEFQSWDAFLTFVIKQTGGDAAAEDLRLELFSVLLEARYDLVEALAPTDAVDSDPVRDLFLRSWARLGPVLRRIEPSLPAESALRYMGFIAASDALAALDQLGPDLDIEISSDGLRRLARVVAPETIADPLEFDYQLDPDLRRLSGFGPAIEPPAPNPFVDLSRSWVGDLLAWFAPEAWAVVEGDVLARLNRWVPSRAELDDYLPLVRDVLTATTEKTLAKGKLPGEFQQTFRWLVLATAWQESCWRQFVRKGQSVAPITSSVGAVGLMQINQRVWRGMYDVQGLRGDIAYNARAGTEIAIHYLNDYAIRRGEHKQKLPDSTARATYCIYNGGPGAIRRYRNPKASSSGRAIDSKFWDKYKAVKAGREMDVATCWGP